LHNKERKGRVPQAATHAGSHNFRASLELMIATIVLFLSTSAFPEIVPDTYKAHCHACHGSNGAGDTMIGKNLKLRPLGSHDVQQQSDEELFAVISKGRDRMPAFDRKLTKDQIWDLVKYIRTLRK
jgi:hypothetical protein